MCAQVEVDAALACKDVDSDDFTITTRISGETDGGSCGAEDAGGEAGSSHSDCAADSRCTIQGAPTMRFDVVCDRCGPTSSRDVARET